MEVRSCSQEANDNYEYEDNFDYNEPDIDFDFEKLVSDITSDLSRSNSSISDLESFKYKELELEAVECLLNESVDSLCKLIGVSEPLIPPP
ncbi:unnamed protein product [Protopolystoma xenopodis]|uniref:Uncharacterized protein n=1 Tax=Protopolystoma xenopodis TaxID=117903 RepID=A0A448X2V1_9PLAT|nr:unnamed protein product [Protopolystoma xenopodis]